MKNNIISHTIITLDIYGFYEINVVIAKDIIKARNKFSKRLNGKLDDSSTCDGLHSYGSNTNEAFIFLQKGVKVSVICHEAFHATLRVMNLIGAKLNKGSEESYAYLLDYIVESIINIVDEK